MDKNSVTGLLIIGLIMIVWLQFMSPEKKTSQKKEEARREQVTDTTIASAGFQQPAIDLYGQFSRAAEGTEKFITVENDLYTITLSSKGAALKSVVLKQHLDGDRKPFNLISDTVKGANSIIFITKDGKKIDTRDLYFAPDATPSRVTISGDRQLRIRYVLDVAQDQSIAIEYVFTGDTYEIGYDVQLKGMSQEIAGNEYQLQWDGGLTYSEKNRQEESQNTFAGAYLGGSLVKLDASKESQQYREEQSGETKWVGIRNKYFVAALIPEQQSAGMFLSGSKVAGKEFENYLAAVKMRVNNSALDSKDRFSLYVGPLDYNILKADNHGLEKIMDFGWEWLTRPFAEFVILPIFDLLSTFISNYGVIIIVFAFLIKLVTYPMSIASNKSMKKMTALQPLLKEIQEKYKNEPQKLQSEMALIYKEAGVNPLGGCLPSVLQMPILFAMYFVFRSSIQLRQHGFLWASDLSVPDSVLDFGFAVPIYGNHIALFPILMALTSFIQQKITPSTQSNEQAKIMMYIFPVMMLFFFNNMPAGLGLYYLVFNIASVVQQMYVNSTTSAADIPAAALAHAAPAVSKSGKKGGRKK